MKITRPFTFPNIKPAFEIIKPIKDADGNNINNLGISDRSKIYNLDDIKPSNYLSDIKDVTDQWTHESQGRLYVSGNLTTNHKPAQLARLTLFTFDRDENNRDVSYYDNLEVDHIKPTVPLDNSIYNLRFVTHDENMRNAAESGVMVKKFRKSLIEEICQLITEGHGRAYIAKALNVPPQLVDDVHSGRSHKNISEKYLNKGFEYQNNPRRPRYERLWEANEICKLMEKGYTNSQICWELDVTSGLVTSIAKGISYKDVSCNYDISNYGKGTNNK